MSTFNLVFLTSLQIQSKWKLGIHIQILTKKCLIFYLQFFLYHKLKHVNLRVISVLKLNDINQKEDGVQFKRWTISLKWTPNRLVKGPSIYVFFV